MAGAAFHALKWRYAGAVVQVGVQFAVGVTLARLLSPEAFGIVGMALIPIGFGKLLGDLGFGVAIIQRPFVSARHVRAAYTGSTTLGIVLFTILWFLAPALSRVFMQDTLIPILRVIGILFVFAGMSAAPLSLLRRELRFRTLAIVETSSYVIGYGVIGLSLAVLGYGVWSLVAASVFQALCLAILAIHVIKLSLWPYFRVQEYRDLVRVASAEVLNNLTNYTADNLAFFVVGKWLGAVALGWYNRAFYLMYLPVRNLSAMLFSVMFPVLAQVQGDVSRLGRAFIRMVSLISVISIPVFLAVAAVPEIVLGALFGEQWKPGAGVLRILCLSGPFMALLHVFGSLTHARGRVFSECGRQVIYLVVMGLALWFLLPLGLEGAALAVAIATFARYLLLARLSLTLVGLGWKPFVVAQAPGYLLGLTASAAAYLISFVGDMLAMSDIVQLLMIIPICAISLLVCFLIFPSSWFGDLYPWIIERIGMKFPERVRKMLMLRVSPL